MKPSAYYQQLCTAPNFFHDTSQQYVVEKMDNMQEDLIRYHASYFSKIQLKWPMLFGRTAPKGLYIYGGVGRGKTLLMDLFFETLPIPHKQRYHFHRFMVFIHDTLREFSGTSNPLRFVAKKLRKKAQVICFDEFFVSDITDAMLLGNLFQFLFEDNITLIATSNVVPRYLYWNGLARDKFLPTIALIEKYMEIIPLEPGEDYRFRTLNHIKLYHYPLNSHAHNQLITCFEAFATEKNWTDSKLWIEGRSLDVLRLSTSIVWFTFKVLCKEARSVRDYIEIARMYNTVIMSEVPILSQDHEDAARRFIALVDEFYDRGVTLIISAEVAIEKLYQGRLLTFEFQRTHSRLQEMQSKEYLAKPHLSS